MKVGVIGLGLIGGSILKSLRSANFGNLFIGFDSKEEHLLQALELGLIDQAASMEDLVKNSDLIILAIPVNHAKRLLPDLLNQIKPHQTVVDCGSTKSGICSAVRNHPNRAQYVAAHPIAGTENTGPKAAVDHLFEGKVNIICEKERSGAQHLDLAEKLFSQLKMRVLYMDADEHDRHIAYVSHISHISSFVLGQTVLEIEKDEENIFNMAGSGFASTVRLAKSSPSMWAPIFEQNSQYLSQALSAYIENLIRFKEMIDQKKTDELFHLMEKTNEIRRVLDGIEKNNLKSTN